MRPLPILMEGGGLPSGAALERLKRAKWAAGYEGKVLPRVAVPGSPGPILAVGVEPDWVTDYALLPDLEDEGRITAALTAILMNPEDERIGRPEDLLSKWFRADVAYVGEEEYDGPDNAGVPNTRAGRWEDMA